MIRKFESLKLMHVMCVTIKWTIIKFEGMNGQGYYQLCVS